jgi:steroid delta-isomerase-like uncharacterized protein
MALLSFAVILGACDRSSEEERNLAIAERLFSEVWSKGNVDILDELLGDDYIKHWAATEPTIGKEAMKESIVDWRSSVPDHNEEVVAIRASGDMVFVRWVETGTMLKDYQGSPATGKPFTAAGMGWIRFEGGKIVEEWTSVDDWGTQVQLGAQYSKSSLKPGW